MNQKKALQLFWIIIFAFFRQKGFLMTFAETLHKIRTDKGLSQQKLADLLFVDRSTVASWETGRRVPDAVTMRKIANALNVDVNLLLSSGEDSGERPVVMMVDNEIIILRGGKPILEQALPNADIVGFTKPSEAIEFAKTHKVPLAFLDIEMGRMSGLDLCRELLAINPRMNVIFLTAYTTYSLDAWETGASGFLMKPLTTEDVKKQLSKLRYPVPELMLR